jgi:AGZA family xanthine/uracil permease-like MFS transporter
MGATHWYTLAVGLFIGLGAMAGLIALFVGFIPKAVLAPIFIFIGCEIVSQAYMSVDSEHWPAVTVAFFPTIASLICTILLQFFPYLKLSPAELPANLKTLYQTLTVMGNGFILAAMLWGGLLAYLINQQTAMSAVYGLLCATATLFGLIHSVLPSGEVYLPWNLNGSLHWEIACSYLLLSGMFFVLSMNRK